MKRKPAITYQKYVFNGFYVCLNLIAFGRGKSLIGAMELQQMFNKTSLTLLPYLVSHFYQIKKSKNLSRNAYGQPFCIPGVIMLHGNLRRFWIK